MLPIVMISAVLQGSIWLEFAEEVERFCLKWGPKLQATSYHPFLHKLGVGTGE